MRVINSKNRWLVIVVCLLSLVCSNVMSAEGTELSEEEKRYIEEHSVITVGIDPEFSPYEFIDRDGTYKGISADYLKLIEIKTGLNFQLVEGLSWSEAYNKAVAGEIDVLPCVGISKERAKHFLFSKEYFSFQRVLWQREDAEPFKIKDMEEKVIGVQMNSSHSTYVLENTSISPELFASTEELFTALSYGEIDGAIANYASSKYKITDLGITNLTTADYFKGTDNKLGLAISGEDEILLSIINKGLDHITEEERIDIRTKWIGGREKPDYAIIFRNIVIGAGFGMVVLLIFLYWNYTLQKEIQRRKEIEKELLVAKKIAQEASEAKGRFLAHMSHEIRTPLNAITGQAYLLDNTKTTDIQNKYVRGIKNASYHLLATINEILDFSKIEAGEMSVENIPFAIDDLLDKVGSLLMSKATEKGIRLHVKTDMSLPDMLIGDPTKIEQILINFSNNAIKFTEEGEVRIEVKYLRKDNDFAVVRFSVSDTGIGISEEQKKNLFTPFHQLDSSVTRRFGGTGLGLTISKSIAEMLMGEIHVSSSVGAGSTFSVELPLMIHTEDMREVKKIKRPDFSKLKVLVIDDDQVSREIVVDYLNSYQFDVDQAVDIKDAYQLINLQHVYYDLIVLEFNIQGQNTLELLENLSNTETKVILLANSIIESQYEIAKELGVNHIVMKPVIPSILYDSIVQIFAKQIKEEKEHRQDKVKKVTYSHKILLVEDNEVNQLIGKEILEQKGYEVLVANNGKEAVEQVKKHKEIEIVLMDIHMPIMDGYEATKEIRSFNQQTPIIAMTAVSFTDIREETIEAGMNGYVMKPVDPEHLFIEIEKHIHFNDKDKKVKEEEDSRPLILRLEEISDQGYMDVKQGLNRIGNNEKLYYEILEKFLTDIDGVKDEIMILMKNERMEEAGKVIHRIKGTSGNVGATRLFQSSKLLLETINNKEIEIDIGPYLWEFERDFIETITILKAMLEEVNKEKKEKVKEDKALFTLSKDVEILMNRLVSLLEDSDLDAFKVYNEINEQLPMTNSSWEKVKKSMDQYNFDEARESIKEFGL